MSRGTERDCNSAVLNPRVKCPSKRSYLGVWLVFFVGQPIGGDQNNGHNMEGWELRWSNLQQDCSMHHARVGHSCDGLMRQECSHPVSRVNFVQGLSL